MNTGRCTFQILLRLGRVKYFNFQTPQYCVSGPTKMFIWVMRTLSAFGTDCESASFLALKATSLLDNLAL